LGALDGQRLAVAPFSCQFVEPRRKIAIQLVFFSLEVGGVLFQCFDVGLARLGLALCRRLAFFLNCSASAAVFWSGWSGGT
jgi:hypothetical protein